MDKKQLLLEAATKLFVERGFHATPTSAISKEAGVKTYGFSFGATVGDINNDGWPDIYVSSDYSIPDYFYLNNGDGTFKEVLKEAVSHSAFYGMGLDISDFNNDGFLDIFQAYKDKIFKVTYTKQIVSNDC